MSKKEVTTVNPMQLRIPEDMKGQIKGAADRTFRTMHSEVLYRLKLIDDLIQKGVINAW